MPLKTTRTVHITFGLVNFRCNVYTATEDSGPTLHLTHEHDDGSVHRVTTRYTCKHPDCDATMDWGQCGRAVQVGKDEEKRDILVPLDYREVDALDAKTQECEVLEFVDPAEVPVEMYGSLYFLAPVAPRRPSRNSSKPPPETRPYSLLRESLRQCDLVAIVSISLRNRTARGMLYVRDDMVLLRMLLWPAQVREAWFDEWTGGRWPEEELRSSDVDEAARLIETLRRKFDPDRYVDPYATAVAALVEAKRPKPEPAPVSESSDAQVIDLVARLGAAVRHATAG